MGYHAVNEGAVMNVYGMSSCEAGSEIGKLYSGEVFTCIGVTTGYANVYEIRFRNSSGNYVRGFIDEYSYGPLHYYGSKITNATLGTCYRFRLRSSLNIVTNSGVVQHVLPAGSYIYCKSSTCGQTQPKNIKIVGFGSVGTVTAFDGFATLNYEPGSMINTSFCIYKA